MFNQMNDILIRTENLKKIYKTVNNTSVAVDGLNLSVSRGEFISIMGPSGCGKSSLLNMLGFLDNISEGEYYFMGNPVSMLSETKRSRLRKGNIGFVFQDFNLIDNLTVCENIEMPLIYLKVEKNLRIKKIREILSLLNITGLKDKYPYQISGGEQQRTALGRAVVFNPGIILADEPTGNLDEKNSHNIMELLSNLNKTGITILMVTHEPESAAYSGRIIRMNDGKIIESEK
jgi:putative ABC transport system ATP-binding protein